MVSTIYIFLLAANSLLADATIEWHTAIPWMRLQTKLEIWLKGVASPEDVALAIQHKVDGIMISNHGKLCGVRCSPDPNNTC
jgi:(S)-2-hydroxy-acid oxidase